MSHHLLHSLRSALELIRERRFKEIAERLGGRLYGRWTSIGFRRDLRLPFPPPRAKIPLSIRPLEPEDIPSLFSPPQEPSKQMTQDLVDRQAMLEARFETCFVAVTENDVPCYAQWLIRSSANDSIQTFFKRRFPLLAPDEALLEGAYVPPAFRGLGIMPAAMALIAQRGAEFGINKVITFVEHTNIPSLKGCQRAGFQPYLVRRDGWVISPKLRALSFIPIEQYSGSPRLPQWLIGGAGEHPDESESSASRHHQVQAGSHRF